MNRSHVLTGVLALIVLLAAGGYAAIVSPIATAAPAVPAPGLAAPVASEGDVCMANASSVEEQASLSASMEDAACARCPDGSPMCWSDKQCDTFCGGKGTGDCVQINSCYRCCYCAL